jgi:N-acetylmuramoyl-L-alanine amidase
MDQRRKIIEAARPDLVLSIHLNSLPSSPVTRGFQAFWAKYTSKDAVTQDGALTSKDYAQKIQDTFNKSCLYTNRKAAPGDYFILQCTAYPSVLLECGFLSNASDEKLLQSAQYQKILAQIITKAILE